MDDIVGIDLGTTNSLVGVMEAGFPVLLADANGARLTPSVVHIQENGEPLVGAPAVRMLSVEPAATVASIKRSMGSGAGVRLRGQTYSPEQVSAFILQKLKADAERALGRPVGRAVITVPAYFNDAQRNATKKAGELAGFTVERIVNEPTAAALAYGLDRPGSLFPATESATPPSRPRIAVYDLGGGTFDISILELNNGVFEVLATNGNTELGGDDIDRALLGQIAQTHSERRPPESIARLREALVAAKHRLSFEERAMIEVLFFDGAQSFRRELKREELEEIARPIVERTRQHCLRAMADAKVQRSDLDEVILVGGATRMPIVQRLVGEVFGRKPDVSQNPDEAVAIGATIQAGILSGAVQNVVLLDVTPLSLGIETFGGLMNVIIPRNSTIPTKAGEMFTTAVNNQRLMKIKVLQGEREMARDNWRLGEFEIEFEPAPKGMPRVGVQFEIDANGILRVLARDTKSGAEKIVAIKSAVDVSDEAVEAMIADSLEHAFEDVGERAWTEARLKAEEMLAAVDSALALVADAVDTAEQVVIATAAADVREALSRHELPLLKQANAALDNATQNLAARVVERALLST
ncbi:MAG: Hsp70 family protein [Chthoniobacterales bacterium]